MLKVRLTDVKIDTILGIVRELRAEGLQQGTDFDFEYHAPKVEWSIDIGDGVVEKRYTVFSFYRQSWASWFVLKYTGLMIVD